MKVAVVGGVAAGLSAASQIKRQNEEACVTVFEKGQDVSYGACGMPYNLLFKNTPPERLYALSYGEIVHKRGINYRLNNIVEEIEPEKNLIKVFDCQNNRKYTENYDYLVFAAGAVANRLNEENFKNIYYFKTLDDLRKVKKALYKNKIKKVTLIGAGYVNLELCDVLTELEIKVTILEKMDKILPFLESSLREIVLKKLEEKGVTLINSVEIFGSDGFFISSNKGEFKQEMTVASLGIKPNTDILRNTGIIFGIKNAVKVNSYLQSSIENIFSCGDCACHYFKMADYFTGIPSFTYMPLGTTANKQGKLAGNNIVNIDKMKKFSGILQTSAFKIFELTVATTGMFESQIVENGLEYEKSIITSSTRGAYPGGGKMTVCLYFKKDDGKLLGAQIVGEDVVAKRIDILSAALYSNLSVSEIAEFDLSYAPPFATVWDPVLIATNQAIKKIYKGG
jgi:NADPH-dependent 2,4-dienoyl-CoA reductase/sulfur reductase-like enzyme